MKNIFWVPDLSGTQNQHSSPGLLPDNQTQIMVNVSQTEDGTISHRLGTDMLADLVPGSDQVRGLDMYQKDDGTNYFHMVEGGNLRIFSGGIWSNQESSVVGATSKVHFANFISRHYYMGEGATEYLKYATETGTSTTVSGNIPGKYIASNGVFLMTAGHTDRKNYWSNIASDTFTTATDFVYTSSPATGIATFGNGRPFFLFTENNYTIIDPATGSTDVVGDNEFGCSAHRAIALIRGYLIWPSRINQCFYMLGPNDSYPTEISLSCKNDLTLDAIINRTPGTNWANMAAGVISNRYICSLGDLSTTVKGQTLNDCALEFDFAQQNFRTHSFPTGGIGSVFADYINSSGDIALYAGSRDDKAVYKLEAPGVYTDDNSSGIVNTVSGACRTKHYIFFDSKTREVVLKDVLNLHFKYYAAGSITIKFATNGNETYDNSKTLVLPATSSGSLYNYAVMALGVECKTISLEFSSTSQFVIQGFGFELDVLNDTGLSII